jgi:hypothetical protein
VAVKELQTLEEEEASWPDAPDEAAVLRKCASRTRFEQLPVDIVGKPDKKKASEAFKIPVFAAMPAAQVANLYVGGVDVCQGGGGGWRVEGGGWRVEGGGWRAHVVKLYVRGAGCIVVLHPTPYSLLRTPCTLYPAPYSLLPTPCTLLPTPYSLLPTPYSLHTQPYTLNLTPSTLTQPPNSSP